MTTNQTITIVAEVKSVKLNDRNYRQASGVASLNSVNEEFMCWLDCNDNFGFRWRDGELTEQRLGILTIDMSNIESEFRKLFTAEKSVRDQKALAANLDRWDRSRLHELVKADPRFTIKPDRSSVNDTSVYMYAHATIDGANYDVRINNNGQFVLDASSKKIKTALKLERVLTAVEDDVSARKSRCEMRTARDEYLAKVLARVQSRFGAEVKQIIDRQYTKGYAEPQITTRYQLATKRAAIMFNARLDGDVLSVNSVVLSWVKVDESTVNVLGDVIAKLNS